MMQSLLVFYDGHNVLLGVLLFVSVLSVGVFFMRRYVKRVLSVVESLRDGKQTSPAASLDTLASNVLGPDYYDDESGIRRDHRGRPYKLVEDHPKKWFLDHQKIKEEKTC